MLVFCLRVRIRLADVKKWIKILKVSLILIVQANTIDTALFCIQADVTQIVL